MAPRWLLSFSRAQTWRWRRFLQWAVAAIGMIGGGTAHAECQYTPQNSFVLIGKSIFFTADPYVISLNKDDVIAQKNSEAAYLVEALKQFRETSRALFLFGIIDLLRFKTTVRAPVISDHGIRLFGYARDVDFQYEVTPELTLAQAGDVPADYDLKVTAKATRHEISAACADNAISCTAELSGTASNSATSRVVNPTLLSHPASMEAEILSSPSEVSFRYKIHIGRAQAISLSGCDLSYSQIEITEASDTNRKERRFLLWGWRASALKEAELKGASLVNKDEYSRVYRNLLR